MDSRLRFFLVVFTVAIDIATINAKTFEEELQERIHSYDKLVGDFSTTVERFNNVKADAEKRYQTNKESITTKVDNAINSQQDQMVTFFTNKRTRLDEVDVPKRWKDAKTHAEGRKYTGAFKTMERNFNKTNNAFRKKNVKNMKTSQFNKYLKALDEILSNLASSSLDSVTTKAEQLASGQSTPEQIALKEEKINVLKEEFFKLAKFADDVQFHEEEKQRTEGQSGIKQIRTRKVGSENYYSNTHSGGSFCAIHDHSNNIRTVGMGEFVGVLNGYEFRTRHNDYRLYQPSTTKGGYHEVEDIKFPEVPPEVKGTVAEQITEMREWFKAWANQDTAVRDYTKYFKPIIVYLEGAWTLGAADGKIDEPFSSDRHHIDASSWLDLQDKVRFTSYSGSKSLLENLAHLPTKITRFTDDQEPILAQWNYRLSCHAVSRNIPTTFFQPRFDAASQKKSRRNDDEYVNSRAARFDIEGININGTREQGSMDYNMLDSLMEEIPGKDNYEAEIPADAAFDGSDDELFSANPNKADQKLNLGYYHRAFVQKSKDGKRRQQGQRAFSDRVFVAHTTQDRVAIHNYKNSKGDTVNTKVSFAIPVEMIYLTPLHSWNPYNIARKEQTTGKGSFESPYDGASNRFWYLTPTEFFSGEEQDKDPADTSAGEVFMQTPAHGKQKVRASGTRIIFPNVDGINKKIRQRYPIMPIHGEGSALWKKLNSLEDALGFSEGATYGNGPSYLTGVSHSLDITGHEHIVHIDENDYNQLRNGEVASVISNTETANGHSHQIVVTLNPNRNQPDQSELIIKSCDENDSGNQVCFDHHANTLTVSETKKKR